MVTCSNLLRIFQGVQLCPDRVRNRAGQAQRRAVKLGRRSPGRCHSAKVVVAADVPSWQFGAERQPRPSTGVLSCSARRGGCTPLPAAIAMASMRSSCHRRIQKELAEISLDPPCNCTAGPKGDNLTEWVSSITGPKGELSAGTDVASDFTCLMLSGKPFLSA